MISPCVAGPDLETVGVPISPCVAGPDLEIVGVVISPGIAVDIAVAFVALVAVSVVAVEVDSSGRPRFFGFPNIDYYASCSSSVEVVG